MLDINLNNYHSEVSRFTGTEAYHRWSVLPSKGVLTDGCKYVAEQLQAHWLFDAIASHIDFGDHRPDLDMYFSTEFYDGRGLWNTFHRRRREWKGSRILSPSIYTTFPLDQIKDLVCQQRDTEQSGKFFVHSRMLPSEY